MITWHPYPKSPSMYAEVGAFILEAHPNGSWVVRHTVGRVPCAHSEMENVINPGADLETAKAKAEKALSELLPQTDAVNHQKAITMKLCDRYRKMREASTKGGEQAAALAEALDTDVQKFITNNSPK